MLLQYILIKQSLTKKYVLDFDIDIWELISERTVIGKITTKFTEIKQLNNYP